jgi:hypothetical protein
MNSLAANTNAPDRPLQLQRVARFERLRALAWDGDILYASRGYSLLCAKVTPTSAANLAWQKVANFSPPWWRNISSSNRLGARLCRDGFHAMAVLPSQAIVAAVPGAIITLSPGASEFHITHSITRGTRPLHIAAIPGGQLFWGEYFDNAARDEVHIYSSRDNGATWNIAYTFSRGSIRHIHNIVHDPWQNCLWILTGDYGDECRILRASYDFSQIDGVLKGNQQARAVALVPTEDGVYFSSDTPLEKNFVYRLDRQDTLEKLAPLNSSSIYGCRVGESIFFSTMAEPSPVNTSNEVSIYAGAHNKEWRDLLSWQKDFWSMRFFQYGNAFLPDGDNSTEYLAVTTIAVEPDDMSTSLYSTRT